MRGSIKILMFMFVLSIVFMGSVFANGSLNIELKGTDVYEGQEAVYHISNLKEDVHAQVFVRGYGEDNTLTFTSYGRDSVPAMCYGDIDLGITIESAGKYTLKVLVRYMDNEGINFDWGTIDVHCKKQEVVEKAVEKKVVENKEKIIYLTFDDGPSSITTKVLDILDEYDIKATFFVIGKLAEEYPKLIKDINDRGHIVANHTYSHNYKHIYSDSNNLIDEIKKTDKILAEIIPGYNVKIFRFPGGSFNRKRFIPEVEKLGYKHFNWQIDSGDTHASVVPVETIVDNIMGYLWYDKSIVLFHDAAGKKTLPEALIQTIEALKEKGYKFEQLKEDTMSSF